MIQSDASPCKGDSIRLADRPCPRCGMAAPAILATLPSGRRALIEACAICCRQEATAVDPQQAAVLLEGRHGRQPAGELA